jgi:hypothetical protein
MTPGAIPALGFGVNDVAEVKLVVWSPNPKCTH